MRKKSNIIGSFLEPLIFFCIVIGIGSFLLKEDFGRAFVWWLMLFVLGLAAYPVTGLIFNRFHDGGLIFSKAIGIAEAGILMWYLSSLKIMKFTRVNSIVCVGICIAVNVFLVWLIYYLKKKKAAKGEDTLDPYQLTFPKISAALKSEVIFLLFFLLWCYLRGFKPEAYGTEKFMDYGFMAVMDRCEYMPPEDLWMAGEKINYYYVGQYLAAYLSKVSGTGVAYGYNLMLMTLAAFGFSMPFSLVNNIMRTYFADKYSLYSETGRNSADKYDRSHNRTDKNSTDNNNSHNGTDKDSANKYDRSHGGSGRITKNKKKNQAVWGMLVPPLAGVTAGLAVSIAGNMHFLIFRYMVPFAEKLAGQEVSSFWFPNSTRYIGYNPDTSDKTIHEFPSYSFVLGDLHAHVINIMFVLTVLGMLFAWLLYRKEKMDQLRLGQSVERPPLLPEAFHPMILLLGFFIGVFHMTNFWDFPIYFVVAGAVILFSNAVVYQFSIDVVKLTALQAVVVLFISKLVSLPFTLNFNQISTEICLCTYRTPLHQLAVLWGLPSILLIIYICDRYLTLCKKGLITDSFSAPPDKKRRNKLYQFIEKLRVSDLFIVTIGLCAMGLVMIPEIIYVKDIYSGSYKRANTMFKLTYQAYIMFGICMAYILIKLIGYGKNLFQKTAGIVLGLCFVMTLGYFGNAVNGWFGNVFDRSRYKGLDASAFIEKESIQDAQAIAWLNENIKGLPVVLEANGDSYTFYERVSVLTGLPTVLGWRTHEWLWRSDSTGEFPAVVSEREGDLIVLYTSTDKQQVWDLIEKYNIEYIYVGESERSSSKFEEPVNEELIRSLGEIVFETKPDESDSTTYIVKIKR